MKFSANGASAVMVCFLALILISSRPSHMTELSGLNLHIDQAVNATPVLLDESVSSKEFRRCARVVVPGLSRLQIWRYSSVHRITLVPSREIHEKAYKKIRICLHNNSSLGSCQCESDCWEIIHTGEWTSVISPYGERYIDVKFVGNLSGFVTVSSKLEFQRWRAIFLAIGIILLLLAPIVSNWVPFYYSSSMTIGSFLVVIIILFQGMKLLPIGRKNTLYSTICGLAIGSFLLNRFLIFVNSVLPNLGISQEMQNPVLIFFLVGVVLVGAGFGYWFVRKFIIVEDGSVDVSISKFVKWALCLIAVVFLFQSTIDTPLALSLLASLMGIYFSFPHLKCRVLTYSRYRTTLKIRNAGVIENRSAEFLSRSAGKSFRRSPLRSSPQLRSPVIGLANRSSRNRASSNRLGTPSAPTEYYSTFHKSPNKNKFTEEEWNDFTEESTHQAIAELSSSPDLAYWIIQHADKIQLHQEGSSEESIGSS